MNPLSCLAGASKPAGRQHEIKALPAKAWVVAACTALIASGCSGGGTTGAVPSASTLNAASQQRLPMHSRALPGGGCPSSTAGNFNCTSQPVGSITATYVNGFTPSDIQQLYGLPSATAVKKTSPLIVVVAAYDTPNAEADLAVYRSQFGLPACTSQSGCFTRLTQSGSTSGPWPSQDNTWNAETMLDLEMASASCPGCRITLVEASSANGLGSMANATVTAANLKPSAISESWGTSESVAPDMQTVDLEYNWKHPGIPIVASTGDNPVPEFPATSQYVIAVGGVQVDRSTHAESAWQNSGGGCSINDSLPGWQTNSYGCRKRGVPDVVGLAAGAWNDGVATYNSVIGGWYMMTGTSVAAPIVAGAFAAANDYPSSGIGAAPLYAKASRLRALPSGCFGNPCRAYGLGQPNGLGAF